MNVMSLHIKRMRENDECKDVPMDPLEVPNVVFIKHNNRSKLLFEYDIKTIPSM